MRTVASPRRRFTMSRREAIAGYLFVGPALLGFLLFQAAPLALSLFYSLTNFNMLDWQWVGLRNYQRLFTTDDYIGIAVGNTLYLAVIGVPLGIIAGLGLAVLLNQNIPGMRVFRTIYYLPVIMPTVAATILWINLFSPTNGLINNLLGVVGIRGPQWFYDPLFTKPALIIMGLWGVGGSMVLYLAGLQGVPKEVHEAAQIDGAGRWQAFRNVTIPAISPVLFFTFITGIIGSLQIFNQVYVIDQNFAGGQGASSIGGPGFSTLVYMTRLFDEGFRQFRMGYASAMAVLLFVFIMLLTGFLFKVVGARVYTEMS